MFNEANRLFLKFNCSKSVCIKFSKIHKYVKLQKLLKLGNNTIKFVEKVKYFGFIFNYNLSNKNDIIRQRNLFYKNFRTACNYKVPHYSLTMINLKQFSVGIHKAL